MRELGPGGRVRLRPEPPSPGHLLGLCVTEGVTNTHTCINI